MFAFDLRGRLFPDRVRGGGEMAGVTSCRIRIARLEPKRLAQLVSRAKDCIRPTPERRRQDNSGEMVTGMPQPALLPFVLHDTPQLLDLSGRNPATFHRNGVRTTALNHDVVHWRAAARFFLTL